MRRNRPRDSQPAHLRHSDARRAWLQEAARLIVQPPGYPRDAALRRAAATTGIRLGQQLDFDDELAAAVRGYRELFRPDAAAQLRRQRETALEAMRFLDRFHPRLLGAVLDGSAHGDEPIQLALFPESAKDVVHWLHGHDMPYDNAPDLVLQLGDSGLRAASLQVIADGIAVQLILLPGASPREAIRLARGEAAERLISAAGLERLLADEG